PAEIFIRLAEGGAKWIGLRERYVDSAYRDADDGPDLQKLQPNRVALGMRQLGLGQTKLPQSPHHYIRHRREHHPQLIGAHRRATHPAGEQEQLLLFDAVLHVAPTTVFVLVERLRGVLRRRS